MLGLKQTWKRSKRCFAGVLARSMAASSRLLSFDTATRLGGVLGGCVFYLAPQQRRRALAHIRKALGDELDPVEQARIIKQMFRNFGRFAMQAFKLKDLTPAEISALVDVSRAEPALRKSLNAGRSAMIVTGHFSNWELFAARMALLAPLTVLARTSDNPALDQLIAQHRKSINATVLDRDDPRVARSLRTLSQTPGQVLGVLMDQDTRVKGIFSPFLGIPANTPSGPAAMAVKGWFDVFAGFVFLEKDGRYTMRLTGPLEIVRTGSVREDIQTNTDRFNELISRQIKEDPAQWVWMHRRWRRRPENGD